MFIPALIVKLPPPDIAVVMLTGPPFASHGISFRYDARADMLNGSTSGRRCAWSGPRPIIAICLALRPSTPFARS